MRCGPRSSSTTRPTRPSPAKPTSPGDRPGEYERGAETIRFDKTVFRTPQTINLNPALGQLELSDQTGTETTTGPTAGVTIKANYTTAGPANSVFKIDRRHSDPFGPHHHRRE